MPVFAFDALTSDGKKISGEVEAADARSAIRRLQDDGLIPIGARAKEKRAAASSSGTSAGFSLSRLDRAVSEFTREFATLLSSGQTVEQSLQLLVETAEHRGMRAILTRVLERVRGGHALPEALAEWPRAFPPFYVAMIRAGEAAGRLEHAVTEIAALREKREALSRKLISSMIYPSILFLVALAALVLLLTVVVPRFAPLFASAGSLPLSTQMVLAVSQHLETYGPMALVGFLILFLLAGQILRLDGPQRAVDRVIVHTPLLGRFVRDQITAQFARGLSSLLEGGLDLPTALLLSRDMVGNRHGRRALDAIVGRIREGGMLHKALADADILAPAGLRMLRVGEESGRLKEVARHVADAFEERASTRLTRLVALAEPITIVVMGLLVGGIVLSILNAVMSVYDVAR